MSITIPRNVSLNELEDLLTDIGASSKSSLRLPNRIRLGGLGIETALVQLIISWARKHESTGELHTYLKSVDDAESFVTSLHGLVASSIAPRISLVDHSEVERKRILQAASDLIGKMDAGDFASLQRGPSLFMTTISGARKRYLYPIYKKAGEVKSPSELAPVVREILQTIGGASGDKKSLEDVYGEEGFYDNVAWLLFELFQNTEDHALRDWTGTLYKRTVSGFMVSIQKIADPEDWKRIFTSFKCDWLSNATNIRLLELSVFDSGPGMARRWLGKDFGEFSFNDECEATIACFNKNETSKAISGRGIGLNNFLTLLSDQRGLLRVRSGRTELIKSFVEAGNKPEINRQAFSKEKASVEGTLISAFIPLAKKSSHG